MSTFTVANTYAHTVTFATSKMLLTMKEIIREIGLDPSKLSEQWAVLEKGISTWLHSRHLKVVVLEVYKQGTGDLATRWQIDVVYSTVGDGSLWVDIAQIKYAIAKAGLSPSGCSYQIKVENAPGEPKVDGWSSCEFRSTEGFRRFAIGPSIGGTGLAAETSYWSR